MSKISALIVAVVAAVTSFAGSAFAESATPSKIVYDLKESENERAKVCRLILDFQHAARAEVVELAIVIAWDKQESTPVSAFTMAVVDLKAEPVKFIRLASMGFSGSAFNSAGMMQKQSPNSSVWVFTDREETVSLLESVVAGNFRVIFVREEDEVMRVYQIPDGPSEEVQRGFAKCIGALAPKMYERDAPSDGVSARSPADLVRDHLPEFGVRLSSEKALMDGSPRLTPLK